jgi:hypothetical protein
MEQQLSPRAARSRGMESLAPGTTVHVRNSLDSWSTGFRVDHWANGHCYVRRLADDTVLPYAFPSSDIRPV